MKEGNVNKTAICFSRDLSSNRGGGGRRGAAPARAGSLDCATPQLIERLRADPYVYFRFVNRSWGARVCDVFGRDRRATPIVRLHGDAHLEQFAVTKDAWGLDDFDDSARGPAAIDIVRFLGSIALLTQSPTKDFFTKLVNLRSARQSAVAESSIYQPIAVGIYIAQS